MGIGETNPSATLHVNKGTNGASAFPSGGWAAKIFNQTDASTEHGLVVANRWAGSTSTAFEVGGLYDNGNGFDTLFKVDGVGNVGIGTSAPTHMLTVGEDNSNNPGQISLGRGGVEDANIFFTRAGVNDAEITYNADEDLFIKNNFAAGDVVYSNNLGAHIFKTASAGVSEALRIDSGGNVGIGTSTPDANLDVHAGALGGTSGDRVDAFQLKTTTSNSDYLNFSKIRDADGTDWNSAGWRIQQKVDTTNQGYVQFNGSGNGGGLSLGTNNTERMRINASGNITATGSVTATSFSGDGSALTNLPSGGKLLQVVTDTFQGVSSTTLAGAPSDITKGLQIFSVSFTPISASSNILVQTSSVSVMEQANVGNTPWISLFDGTTFISANSGGWFYGAYGGFYNSLFASLNEHYASGSTTARTIQVRAGIDTGTAYINGNLYAGYSGASSQIRMTIMEVEA